MSQQRITWLDDVLKARGITVEYTSGWTTRSRPASTGDFNPRGVLLHHTAATSSASKPHPSLTTVTNGRSDLPGPLCHILIGYAGSCWMIAAGRANHAGQARASGPMPAGDGNALYIGIEIDYQGVNQQMSHAQFSTALTASAAILAHLGRDQRYVRGHKETSTTGKIDPGHVDMDAFRGLVKLQL